MKKKIAILIAVIVVLIVGYLKWHKPSRKNLGATTTVISVTQGHIEERVEATGEVVPLNRVEVKPPISGRIETLQVEEGDRVKSGQILAWMSSSDRAAILDAARAQSQDDYKHWLESYKATPIVAPLSGIVILKNVVEGQTVDASVILYAISDKLIVQAHVDEADIGRTHVGMKANVTLDAYPDQPIEGSVFQILEEGKNVSNVITYGVKVSPKTVPPFFKSQMTANVNLIVQEKDNALLIPVAAIRDTAAGTKEVLIPTDEKKPEARAIQLGIQTGEQAEVTSGLSAGDKILLVQNRYSPQKSQASSPFAPGGKPRTQSGGSSGSGRSRS